MGRARQPRNHDDDPTIDSLLPRRAAHSDRGSVVFDEWNQQDAQSAGSTRSTVTQFVLLASVGVISATTAFLVDFAVKSLIRIRTYIALGDSQDFFTSYCIWIIWFVSLAMLATFICKVSRCPALS
jgi:hypothetical protein